MTNVSQANPSKISFFEVLALQVVNYRKLQEKALPLKAELLTNSTINDDSTIFGWRDEYPMEIVSIDCPALYQVQSLHSAGIYTKDDLLAAYKRHWEGELARANASSDIPKTYVEVCQRKLATTPTCVTVGGLHRASIMGRVIATWMDRKVDYTDQIPVVTLTPKTSEELLMQQHRRNAEGESQIGLVEEDIVCLAANAIRAAKSQGEFAHFRATGSYPKFGESKHKGPSVQKAWYLAKFGLLHPSLKFFERIMIDADTKIESELKRRIDLRTIKYLPKFAGQISWNVMRALFCASPEFRKELRGTAQGKSEAPSGSMEESIEQGTRPSWGIEECSNWLDDRCPAHHEGAGRMDTGAKPPVVSVEKVQRFSESSESAFWRLGCKHLLIDPNVEDGDKTGDFANILSTVGSAVDTAFSMTYQPSLTAKSRAFFSALDAAKTTMTEEQFKQLLDDLTSVVIRPTASEVLAQAEAPVEAPAATEAPVSGKKKTAKA